MKMNKMKNVMFILFAITSASFNEAHRILAIYPFHGPSHDQMLSALAKGLANRGHQIDVITHFPLKNAPKNYKVVVDLNGTLESMTNNFTIDYVRSLRSSPSYFIANVYGNRLCDLMGIEKMQKFIKDVSKNPPYDVVIVHGFGANCYMGFGHLLKIPIVAVITSTEFPWMSHYLGNNNDLAVVPNIFFLDYDKTNFWHRLQNVFVHYTHIFLFNRWTEEAQTNAMRKYLDPNMPNVREIERTIALALVNRHPVISGPKSITSSIIETSALHVEENPPKLSAKLQKWLDESTDGVVYFSFGSMVLIETLPKNIIENFYKSFENLAPIRVLMKIVDTKKLPLGLPKNVLTLPWMPQQSVLNHKNVIMFLTHGGLMGCQEALYYGVPMIGVPLFSDQAANIKIFTEKHMVVPVDFNNLTTAVLNEAFNEMLKNPTYRKNAKFYSKLFKDTPMSAMEKATFWIEYVIRNGPNTLRSPALDLYWWQLALLDVFGFILLCIFLMIVSVYYLSKIALKQFSVPRIKEKTQ